MFIFSFFFKMIFLIFCVLIGVAFLTLMERKLLSLSGLRLGPNKPSLGGFAQPVLDAGKLMNKKKNSLYSFSGLIYYVSSFFFLFISLFLWVSSDSTQVLLTLKYPLIFLLLMLGFNTMSSIYAGWSTCSKYSFLGSIRSVVQIISYEMVLYTIFLFFFFHFFSFSFSMMTFNGPKLGVIYPFLLLIWIPAMLAELNRSPYDFSEGESELVSGFNIEHGSLGFTFLFLSEYSNILFFSFLTSLLFFNTFYIFVLVLLIMVLRAALPRYRFDKLMMLCWKFYLPVLTGAFILVLWVV